MRPSMKSSTTVDPCPPSGSCPVPRSITHTQRSAEGKGEIGYASFGMRSSPTGPAFADCMDQSTESGLAARAAATACSFVSPVALASDVLGGALAVVPPADGALFSVVLPLHPRQVTTRIAMNRRNTLRRILRPPKAIASIRLMGSVATSLTK